MDSGRVLAALRTRLLSSEGLTAIVGERIYVSRADVAGLVPAVVLRLNGGSDANHPAFTTPDVAVDIYSATSWQEAFSVQGQVTDCLRLKDIRDGLPEPLRRITCNPPQQMPQGDYFHLVQIFHCVVKEA